MPVVVAADTLWRRFQLGLLPRGYPHTCAPGFPRYFALSLTASFLSNFATSIATQTLLGGFFADSSPRIWMLKDLAPALFAAFVANTIVSYEARPKFWLLVCCILTNFSVVVDMFIPSMIPAHGLLLAAVVTSLIKQSAVLMFFVSRSCALQHFATHQNLAEFTKKFNSFGMVNYTVGTALGIAFTTYVPSFAAQLTAVMVGCLGNVVLHTWSMLPISFRFLNPTTGMLVFRSFVQSQYALVLTPEDVAKQLGVRELVNPSTDFPEDLIDMLSVGPAIESLDIVGDRLEEHVLVCGANVPFLIGIWDVKKPKARVSFWKRWKRRNTRAVKQFGHRKRLVLLVGTTCDVRNLLCAHLIVYSAMMEPSNTTLEDLRAYLQRCNHEMKWWLQKTDVMMVQLQSSGWDVKSVGLDPLEMRIGGIEGTGGKGGSEDKKGREEFDEDDD